MGAVPYFTAVIARAGAGWRTVDVDLEDAESLDELAEMLRGARRGGPVLAVLEREDDWFALVRVDGDDDEARSFVSDLAATERSQYADVLSPVGDVELAEYAHLRVAPGADGRSHEAPGDDGLGSDGLDLAGDRSPDEFAAHDEGASTDTAAPSSGIGVEGEPALVSASVAIALAGPPAWAGDPGLLADVGMAADELVDLVGEREGDPAYVIAAVGERCGFDELLDALR